ncbi:MAG TPA: hypothetical protein VMU84_08090, partial [Thermoanaerobaculia bacterium]|nr:hypothetical protein [Thermoanaerobaculia bacterium]
MAKRPALLLLAFFVAAAAAAQSTQTAQPAQDGASIAISLDAVGDSPQGVVARIVFRLPPGTDAPPETTLLLQGSYMKDGIVLKNFRYEIPPDRRDVVRTTQTFPEGEIEIEARLIMPLDEGAPVIMAKSATKFTVAKTNKPFTASTDDDAEAIFAEGVVPDSVGAVRIRAPRRDVAPNLFIVNVDVLPPVKRVEFWVEGKKVLARNAPPFRAELDLGKIPKRVEVRAIGYDEAGRYVDADAFIVNERETPLEVKITRTVTPDGLSHFKLSIQNPKMTELKTIALYAGPDKIHEWTRPPYALDLPSARLNGVDFVRASV